MFVASVNVGAPAPLRIGARTITTGIDKRSVGRARVTRLGVEGDAVVDTEHHGGPDQALYVYAADDYAWWEAELQASLEPGTFGENILLDTFDGDVHPGDRFRLGDDVLIEATAPRIPCGTFASHLGVPRWIRRFAAAERPGFYARVLSEGVVTAADRVERTVLHPDHPTVVELMRAHYDRETPEHELLRLLRAPIAERERASLERRLAAVTPG